MSKFQRHLELWIKHYPVTKTENDSIIRNLANMSAISGSSEEDIIDICGSISDDNDNSFVNGVNAINL